MSAPTASYPSRTPGAAHARSALARLAGRGPLAAAGALWPLALLTPFVPGLPQPGHIGFAWRQELAVALLLSATFALLLRRRTAAAAGRGDRAGRARPALLPVSLLAAFVAWGAASALWATNVFAALHYALSWVSYLLLFSLLARAYGSPRVLRWGLGALGLVLLVIGGANVAGHLGSVNSLLRANGLGEPLAVSIPLFASLALGLRRRRAALLSGLVAALSWLAVLQIAERAAFIAVCAGLCVLAAAMLFSPRFRPRTLARVALLGLAFAACLAAQYAPTPFEQSAHRPVLARLGATSADDLNARARFLYWGAALEMWRARPLSGVGAGGYGAALPDARAAFAGRHPGSTLTGVNEKFLSSEAHNEYLQMLAELGAVGFGLFAAFCAALVRAAWRALRVSRGPLVPGAVASLAVFAVSSGASAVSFRWMGSGLIFFFAAALVARRASCDGADAGRESEKSSSSPARLCDALTRPAPALGLALALLVASVMAAQAVSVQLAAAAQMSADASRAEGLFRAALSVNRLNPATRYQFGTWLFHRGRERDALPHLRYAVERGYNTSTCFAYLAAAEAGAGDEAAAERTLRRAVEVFPRSVFLRARHAAALARTGRAAEAELEMAAALLLDSRAARGWHGLINDDIDAASEAARRDPGGVAAPGELDPDDAVFAVLKENERRFPEAARTGWRARVRRN
ncbi:MAG TPA: O-antigen ligase family protein [Pyrinomonadaceae bacterium]